MYHRGQGIRKSSHLSRPRRDRVLRSNAVTSFEQQAQELASVSSSQNTHSCPPESPSKSYLAYSEAAHSAESSTSHNNIGLASEPAFTAGAGATVQDRHLSNPELRFWPSQASEVSGGPQAVNPRSPSELLFKSVPDFRSPAAAMRQVDQTASWGRHAD